jgi:hypothetical protein
MKREVIGIFIMIQFFFTTFNVVGINKNNIVYYNNNLINLSYDGIDQQQTKFDGYLFLIHHNQWISQSFIPSKSVLTRVFLYLYKWKNINYEVTVSIRKELDDDDLTSLSFIPSLMEPPSWIEVDFNDIAVSTGETYYIVCSTNYGSSEDNMYYGWGFTYDFDSYPDGLVYVSLNKGISWDVWIDEELNISLDSCFMTYGYDDPNAKSDLECDGSLCWDDIKAGEIVTGDIIIENIGFNGSLLEWEITNYPSWGDWTFSPDSGEGLTPEDEYIIVQVTVRAPNEKEKSYKGEVEVTNRHDSNDRDIIPVSLSTPKNRVFTRLFLPFYNSI